MNNAKQWPQVVKPVFVETIPEDLSNLQIGTLYISMKYNTLVHRCPCGCGGLSEVGLSPATRKITYDGKNVSIDPSIGIRSLSCRSHYWIANNRIEWAEPLQEDSDGWRDRHRQRLTEAYEQKSRSRQSTGRNSWWSRFMHKAKSWLR